MAPGTPLLSFLRSGLLAGLALAATLAAAGSTPAAAESPREITLVELEHENFETKLLVTTLQGQVNAETPQLFVDLNVATPLWFKAIEDYAGVTFITRKPKDVIAEFLPKVGKQVIADRDRPWTIAIATTIAGLEGAAVTLRDRNVETVFDTRGMWKDKADGYAWAMKELLPRTNPDVLAFLDDELPNFRDWVVQDKLMVIDLDPLNDEAEIALLDEILAKYEPMTPVLGWPADKYADPSKGQDNVTVEHALVDRLSKRDMMLVPADYADNVSFLRDLKSPKKLEQEVGEEPPYDDDTRFVTLVISDGDNMQFNLNMMRQLWAQPGMHAVPMGWTFSPQWAEVAPAVAAIFYAEAKADGTRQEFIAGPSGYAYVQPGSFSDKALAAFVRKSDEASAALDLRSVVILDKPDRAAERAPRFLKAFSGTSLGAAWLAEFNGPRGVEKAANGQDLVYLPEASRLDEKAPAMSANHVNVESTKHRFQMVYVDAWTINPEHLATFRDALDPGVRIVPPRVMRELVLRHGIDD